MADALVELSRVISLCEIKEDDDCVPVGATGTIVDVNGFGYVVEFTSPHVVISVRRDEIDPI